MLVSRVLGGCAERISASKASPSRCETRYQHLANAEEPVYLYRLDDKPMIGALGFYRSGDMDFESLVDE
ncbi:hypothetical protein N7501_004779 [Penicillium viridicatum]|nr:hypothetical protein N7501_004779 [Penicillium viridicatum]